MPPFLLAGLLVTAAQSVTFPSFVREGEAVAARVEVWQQSGPVRAPVRGEAARAPFTLALTPGSWNVRVSAGPHFRRVERVVTVPASGSLDFGAVVLERAVDTGKLGWLEDTVPAPAAPLEFGAVGAGATPGLAGMASYDALAVLRRAGGATFATVRHSGLAFDLAAARLIDGLVVTEETQRALATWSMLLDHGYRVAPIATAPARLAVPCAEKTGARCLAEGIGQGRTVVSTGPTLLASERGGEIAVEAWARQDQPDRLQRLELWAHNRVVLTQEIPAADGQHFATRLAFTGDWAAVRLVAESGWALSHAFFAAPPSAPAPLLTQLQVVFPEIASQQQAGAVATVWSGPPGAPGVQRLQEIELERNELTAEVPVTSLVRIELVDGRSIDLRPFVAGGIRALLPEPEPPEWGRYEEVLRRCRRIIFESRF